MPHKRIALITGANQGVGLRVAKELVANGVTVLVGARNFERGEAAAREMGSSAVALQFDVTDRVSIAEAAERIREKFGRLDLLVQNAAISNTRKGSLSLQEYAKVSRPSDQVFGDLGYGNGDPKLAIFGEQTTPNAHMLARKLVTLDNLYCDGEVSEDGHQWSNAAYATDFNEKAWTNSYSGRGEPEADERLMSSPAGYLWDACARHHLTFRTYGEMARFVSSPDIAPQVKAVGSLAGHVSTEWLKVAQKGGRDTDKAAVFIRELQQAERSGDWPNFMVMSLGEDHTRGLLPGSFTPIASVASNDEALGEMVHAISHSRFWKETAIFVIEDDAQNGPDHVDAHRTVGLVISPWVKRRVVDSTMYTTSSFVRTMELILGLPPMTQFDNAAAPMYATFTAKPLFDPIDAQPLSS